MYSGMENIRGEGEQYEVTEEFRKEYFRCASDVIYFAEKYVYIRNNTKGKHLVELYDYQKKALKIFGCDTYDDRENAIILMSRQMGKCVTGITYITIRNHKTGEIKDIRIGDLFGGIDD